MLNRIIKQPTFFFGNRLRPSSNLLGGTFCQRKRNCPNLYLPRIIKTHALAFIPPWHLSS
uniref:Uncharacterized protein n=1 Tax=Anguilla anguilla TaxID=7936 RepID=A0A0E9XQK3_ANGAN